MNDFFRQYFIKDTGKQIETIDEFLKLRVGAELIKNTGDEYIKSNDNVFDKHERRIQSTEESDKKYAQLGITNNFSHQQNILEEPTESSHVATKEYVDNAISGNLVDSSHFARTDESNVFEMPQICASEPTSRTHLTNKKYVDEAIDSIMFDTSQLASINRTNEFSEPQICTGKITNELHLTTKKYVDNKVQDIIIDTTNYVRSDFENTFTRQQIFDAGVLILSENFNENNAVNKRYLDSQLAALETQYENFAKINERNIFTDEQTFNSYVSCSLEPTANEHMANKKYVDDQISTSVPDMSRVVLNNKENTFESTQYFNDYIFLSNEPTDENHVVNKKYVDDRVGDGVSEATTEKLGIVKLSPNIATADLESKNVPTDYTVKKYVDERYGAISFDFVDTRTDQTINGNKTFKLISLLNDNASAFKYKVDNITFNLNNIRISKYAPDSGLLDFTDSNNRTMSSSGFYYVANEDEGASTFTINEYGLSLSVKGLDYNDDTDDGKFNELKVGFDSSNNPFTSVITPAPNSNDSNIANTKWVNNKINSLKFVGLTTNNTFSGTQTFNNTITASKLATFNDSVNIAKNLSVNGVTTFKQSPTVPTPPITDNSTKIATTAFVKQAITSQGDGSVPTGTVILFAGNRIPNGWLLCNGQSVSRTTYANLWAALGKPDTGDKNTTFMLPTVDFSIQQVRGVRSIIKI